jgi:major membrane immunogen (membrane-anchored lipoprotein)
MKVKRVLVVVLIFLIIILGCESKKIAAVPENLIGLWGTSDPKYADRTFEITRNEIIFQTGENTFDTYSIKSLEMEKATGKEISLYTINYKNKEGLKYKLSFYYNPAGQGEIRHKNQPKMVWTKKTAS